MKVDFFKTEDFGSDESKIYPSEAQSWANKKLEAEGVRVWGANHKIVWTTYRGSRDKHQAILIDIKPIEEEPECDHIIKVSIPQKIKVASQAEGGSMFGIPLGGTVSMNYGYINCKDNAYKECPKCGVEL